MGQKPVSERMAGMCCPQCGSYRLAVRDSRPITYMDKDAVRRSRQCLDCGARHFTVEILEAQIDEVVQMVKTKAALSVKASVLSFLESV